MGSLIQISIDPQLMFKLAIALALGAFIGAEREMIQQRQNLHEFGGIRSFMFISLLGFVSMFLAQFVTDWFTVIVLLVLASFLIVGYAHKSFLEQKSGITSELGAVLTFIVGVIAYIDYSLAIIVGIIVALVLSVKAPLHAFVNKIKDEEFFATVEFALLAFVILPLLPNRPLDPWGIFNPYEIWLLIVFILGISFVGYILHRSLGSKRGLLLTGFVGGIISSTALTQSMATRSKLQPKLHPTLAAATIIATSIMFVRVILIVSPLNQALLWKLALPIGVMFSCTIVEIIVSLIRFRKKNTFKEESTDEIQHESPFKLFPAIKFGLLFISILAITEFAKVHFGEQGIYLTALITGLADVDIFLISMVKLIIHDPSFASIGAKAITLAIVANMISKSLIPFFFGDRKFAKTILKNFLIIALFGLFTLLFI